MRDDQSSYDARKDLGRKEMTDMGKGNTVTTALARQVMIYEYVHPRKDADKR